MLQTDVLMNRTTLLMPDGSSIYQIDAAVTDKGELLYSNLFVIQIIDELDTTRDTFVRVGTPYDMENIYRTRVDALANAQVYYITPSWYWRYTDLSIAVQAKDAVRSRIDNAVNAWYTYKTAFEGTETVHHPTAEATYEQQLQDSYVVARDARLAAETAVVAADVALSSAQTTVADAVSLGAKYKESYDFTNQSYGIYWFLYYAGLGRTQVGVPGILGSCVTQLEDMKVTFLGLGDEAFSSTAATLAPYTYTSGTFDANMDAWLHELQALNNAVLAFRSIEPNGPLLETSFSNFSGTAEGNYASQQGVIATANVTVAAAVTAKKEAEASLASAQSAEDAALAAARAICPDFDPSSV